MEQRDSLKVDFPEASHPKRPALWVMRSLFGVCSVMMALIILSDPRISSHLFTSDKDALASNETALEAPPPVATEEILTPEARETPKAPVVSVMPADQVPVRRGGFNPEE